MKGGRSKPLCAFSPSAYKPRLGRPCSGDPNDRDITVQISVPIADVSLVDIVGVFQTGNLRAVSIMRQE